MQSDRVKSLIEKHGPLTLNEIKSKTMIIA